MSNKQKDTGSFTSSIKSVYFSPICDEILIRSFNEIEEEKPEDKRLKIDPEKFVSAISFRVYTELYLEAKEQGKPYRDFGNADVIGAFDRFVDDEKLYEA